GETKADLAPMPQPLVDLIEPVVQIGAEQVVEQKRIKNGAAHDVIDISLHEGTQIDAGAERDGFHLHPVADPENRVERQASLGLHDQLPVTTACDIGIGQFAPYFQRLVADRLDDEIAGHSRKTEGGKSLAAHETVSEEAAARARETVSTCIDSERHDPGLGDVDSYLLVATCNFVDQGAGNGKLVIGHGG